MATLGAVPGRTGRPVLTSHPVTSADGTVLEAWTNGADGPTVLLCNGLGTTPYTWPELLDPDCPVRIISWSHRGTGGSARPHDRARVDVHTFVEDAVAVLDDAGVGACVVAGWSMGVNAAFQLAVDYPGRVLGLFAVAGVPGGTFETMLGPLPLRPRARRALAVTGARVVGLAGPLLTPVVRRLPMGRVSTTVLRHSGFMLPRADPEQTALAVRGFFETPIQWYMHLAVAASRHVAVPLAGIRVPTMFVAGRWDVLAGSRQMRAAAAEMLDASYVELPGSHFVPLEHGEEALRLLAAFVERVHGVPAAV